MMKRAEILSYLDQADWLVGHDTYWLTRGEQDSIQCRIQQLKEFIIDVYRNKQPQCD